MTWKSGFFKFWILSLILLCGGFAQAQITTGRISGTVTDPNGAVVQNAAVTITNLDTNLSRQANTSEDGSFAVQLLPPGRYRVEIAGSSFQPFQTEAVVNITETTTVDAQLGVGGGTTTVTVEPEAPVLQTETSQNGRVIEQRTIQQIPLPTRNFQQLLTLSAGAQSSVSNNTELGRGDATITVNGQRTTSNSVRINGVDANSIGTNSTPNIAVPAPDSLQEFIVQTSLYDASQGRNAGGNVEAVTRSGSNDFRGNVYYFLRNRRFNANEPFVKARGLERPVLDRHQFGATFGGPIVRDRVFFFGSYQGTRERNGLSLNNSLTFPNIPAGLQNNRAAAALAAAFSTPAQFDAAGNLTALPFALTTAQVNPVALAILNAQLSDRGFAIPSSGLAGANGLAAIRGVSVAESGLSRFRENQFNANGDINFTDNHTFSIKTFFADNPTEQAIYNFAGLGNRFEGQPNQQLIGFGGDLEIKQTLLSFTDTYVINSNISNQARFGFNRLLVTSVPQEPFSAQSLGINSPLASSFAGAPTISFNGSDAQFFFGSAPLSDQSSRINAWTAQDILSIVAGKHRIRTGGEFRYSTVKFFFNAFSRGQLNFTDSFATVGGRTVRTATAFQNFLTGNGISLLGSGVFDRSFRVKDLNLFVQDDFRVNDRLTLNLGLRYDFYGLPVERDGRLVNFIPQQLRIGTALAPAAPPNGIVQAANGSLPGVPTVEETLVPVDKNNFAPRVGFAYRLDEDARIILRGGYGVYYDRISTRFANTQLFNYPYFGLGVGLVNSAPLPVFRPLSNPFIPLPRPEQFPVAPTVPSPLSPLAPVVGVPISGVFVDPELQTPYVQQYNFGLQWELVKNTVLEVGYVGNKGTRLLQIITLNQPTFNPATNTFTTPFPANVISPNKNVTGGVQQVQTTSLSNYNSLQTTLTRRFASGAQIIAAYTFGKSIDYYSGTNLNELGNVAGDQFDWRTNRGRSDFNREHRLVVSGVYDLPSFNYESSAARAIFNNFQIAGVAVFQSGLPFSVIDSNGTTIIQRANFNRSFNTDVYPEGGVSERLNNYFVQNAFVSSRAPIDPTAPFGNTPRNFLTGPGQKNVDLSVIKFIPINERFRAEFRTEFFNIFNWVNYANPGNNIAAPATFGRITSASTGPRVIQFAFRLNF